MAATLSNESFGEENSFKIDYLRSSSMEEGEEAMTLQDQEILQQIKTQKSDFTFKIMCVGDYTGFGKKGGFVLDYINDRPLSFYHKPTIGVDFYLHFMKWADVSSGKDRLVKLQFWDLAEHERFLNMTSVYCRSCSGALVFWGPKSPSSLSSCLKWSQKIREANPRDSGSIPMVLIIENIPTSKRGKTVEWIGQGKMVDNVETLNRFCRKNGFLNWFELTSREGEGYTGVMQKAVNCLVQEIFERKQN